MAIKNVVIPLEIEYLQTVAKQRGISRTKLVRVVMQKVLRSNSFRTCSIITIWLNQFSQGIGDFERRPRRFRKTA